MSLRKVPHNFQGTKCVLLNYEWLHCNRMEVFHKLDVCVGCIHVCVCAHASSASCAQLCVSLWPIECNTLCLHQFLHILSFKTVTHWPASPRNPPAFYSPILEWITIRQSFIWVLNLNLHVNTENILLTKLSAHPYTWHI